MEIEKEDRIPERIIKISKERGLFDLSIPEEYDALAVGVVSRIYGGTSEIQKIL